MRNFIIGFVFGAAASGVAVYLFDKRNYTRKFNDELNEAVNIEVAKVRQYYQEKEEELMEAEIHHVKTIPDKPTVADREREKINVLTRDYRSAEDDRDFDPAESESPSEYDEDEADIEEENRIIEETEIAEKAHEAMVKAHPKCKILEAHSFGEIEGYSCETLRYYVHDKFLVHEDDSLVEDIDFLIGDTLERYGWDNDDKDESSLFVRNYELERDFEVIKVFDEWHGAD